MQIPVETIGYAVVALGAIGLALDRMGFKFIRSKERELSGEKKDCQLHTAIVDCLNSIKRNQVVNISKIEEHTKDLEQGQRDFHEIREEITNIKVGVGVLLDRTGGKPDGWRMQNG